MPRTSINLLPGWPFRQGKKQPNRFIELPDNRIGIRLVSGDTGIIDATDFDLVSPYTWRSKRLRNTTYVITTVYREDKIQTTLHLHQLLIRVSDGLEIDHRDGNGLNNVRSNLRVATPTENLRSTRKRKGTSSVFKGVTRKRKNWTAQICHNRVTYRLGTFKDEREAAAAYDRRAVVLFGEFALANRALGLL